MLKAVIFDLDGTLIDSPLCLDSVREELGIGQNLPILEYVSELPPTEQGLAHEVIRRHEVEAAKEAEPIEGVLEVLQALRVRPVRLGLLTRNCKPATDLVIEKLSLQFDVILTRDCAPPKPDPAGLLQILEEFSLPPESAIYVGDYLFDIQAGQNAGMKTALYAPNEVPSYARDADLVFHSYERLSSELDRVFS